MDDYSLTYTGRKADVKGFGNKIYKNELNTTLDPYKAVVNKDLIFGDDKTLSKGDTVEINPENTYFEVNYQTSDGKSFSLYPRLQENPEMGNVVSPSIRKTLLWDIYTHVTVVGEDEKSWSDDVQQEVKVGEQFLLNDYLAKFVSVSRINEIEGDSNKKGTGEIKEQAIYFPFNTCLRVSMVKIMKVINIIAEILKIVHSKLRSSPP